MIVQFLCQASLCTVQTYLKMASFKLIGLCCFGLIIGTNAWKTYEGYQVLETSPLDETSTILLRHVMDGTTLFDFWSEPQPGLNTKIMAAPEKVETLQKLLHKLGLSYTTKIADVGKTIKYREPKQAETMDWNDYHRHDTINAWLDSLARQYSDYVSTISIGNSYEGRDMKVLAITRAGRDRPNIWIEAGIHAREWIGPAVGTYLVNELLNNAEANDKYLDSFNIYLLPVANPDGYEFCWTDDRMWRKTRSSNPGFDCPGTDPNRNFPVHWGETGTSTYPCSDTYGGSEAFSEIETRNIRDFVSTLDPPPVFTNALHSAAELLLYPYSYSYTAFPDNWQEQRDLGIEAMDALNEVHGETFQCIHSSNLYPSAGDASDYYTELGAQFAFLVELRENGYGFELPADQIIPSGEEMWAAYEVILDKLITLK